MRVRHPPLVLGDERAPFEERHRPERGRRIDRDEARTAQICAKRPLRNAASRSWSTRWSELRGARVGMDAASAALISLSALSWLKSCTSLERRRRP